MLLHQLSNCESFFWVLQFLLTDANKKPHEDSVEGACDDFQVSR